MSRTGRRARQTLVALSGAVLLSWLVAALGASWSVDSSVLTAPSAWRALWNGSRCPLVASVVSVGLSLVAGQVLGRVATGRPGPWRRLSRRSLEIVGSLPTVFVVAVSVLLLPFWPCFALGLGVGLTRVTEVAMLVRVAFARFESSGAREAATAVGSSPAQVWKAHLLPRLVSPLAQTVVSTIAAVTVVDASLAYLHLDVGTPRSSWGNTIAVGISAGRWDLVWTSALATAATAMAAMVVSTYYREKTEPYLGRL